MIFFFAVRNIVHDLQIRIPTVRHIALLKMSSTAVGPIGSAIAEALTQNLSPVHMEVINESYMHNVPKGAESHFKVLVVSDKFQDLTLLKVRILLFALCNFLYLFYMKFSNRDID